MSKKNKVITIILTFLICFNYIFPNISYALTEEEWRAQAKKEFDHSVYKEVKRLQDEGKNEDEVIDGIFAQPDGYMWKHEYNSDTSAYISEDTWHNIQAEWPAIDTWLGDEYWRDIVWENGTYYESHSAYIQYVIEYASEEPEIPSRIPVPKDLYEFETAINNFLENKVASMGEEEKIDYLIKFVSSWRAEINGKINLTHLSDNSLYDDMDAIVFQVVNRYVKFITLSEAIDELREILDAKKRSIELSLPEDTDQETKEARIKEAFEQLKIDYSSKSGTFYDQVIGISKKIFENESRQTFLDNIPTYIDEYLSGELGLITNVEDSIWSMFSTTIDSIAGILLWPVRVTAIIIPGAVIQLVSTLLARVGSENGLKWITIDDIFFNKIPMIDIDIFSFETAADSTISEGNVLYQIRQNVSGWYTAIRNLSIAISLAVLVYIGLRMAISSIADEKAKYKKMFKDWLVSFLLIFVLHYFMVFVTMANNGLVAALDEARAAETVSLATELHLAGAEGSQNMQNRVLHEALTSVSLVRGFGYSFVYLMMTAMMMMFLITYIKRMIIICFLAMIAPLITITYAMDKAGDGKAQAFGKWMAEFMFNVIIQPFHCILYMLFIQNIMYILQNTAGIIQIGKVVVVVVMLGFIYKAENIIRAIFGFDKASSVSSAAVLGAAVLAKAQEAAKTAKNIKGIKNPAAVSKGVKGIKNPSSLPSNAKNAPAPKPEKPNKPEKTGADGDGKKHKAAEIGKKAGKAVLNANVKTGKFIANNVLTSAIAYGMTGDGKAAVGAQSLSNSARKKAANARLRGNIRERQELTRDAYQDYAKNKGLTSKDDRLKEADRLLNADPDSLTDPAEKNMAEWLRAERDMHDMLGSKDSNKDVLKNLADYEDSQA